jgi:hypothetical protein
VATLALHVTVLPAARDPSVRHDRQLIDVFAPHGLQGHHRRLNIVHSIEFKSEAHLDGSLVSCSQTESFYIRLAISTPKCVNEC